MDKINELVGKEYYCVNPIPNFNDIIFNDKLDILNDSDKDVEFHSFIINSYIKDKMIIYFGNHFSIKVSLLNKGDIINGIDLLLTQSNSELNSFHSSIRLSSIERIKKPNNFTHYKINWGISTSLEQKCKISENMLSKSFEYHLENSKNTNRLCLFYKTIDFGFNDYFLKLTGSVSLSLTHLMELDVSFLRFYIDLKTNKIIYIGILNNNISFAKNVSDNNTLEGMYDLKVFEDLGKNFHSLFSSCLYYDNIFIDYLDKIKSKIIKVKRDVMKYKLAGKIYEPIFILEV